MHTVAQAQVSDDGTTATLTQGNARLAVRLASPQGARFILVEAQPLPTSPHPEGQAKNEGVHKLAIHLSGVTDLRLAVLLKPQREGEAVSGDLPELKPLEVW